MKPIPDCVPEALDLVLKTARLVSDDPFIHRKVLRKVMSELMIETDFGNSAVDLTFRCLMSAYKALGVKDPYEKEKARRNKAMLGLEKNFRDYLDVAPDRLSACLNLVLAGTIRDIEALGRAEMEREILEKLDAPVGRDDRAAFVRNLQRAETLLYVLDASGEIVLDKLLIEELAKKVKVTAVVASKPVLTMATMEDAQAIGLPEVCTVVDPGAPMLGLMLERAGRDFRQTFQESNLVLAKGETNFETLCHVPREVYFLLQAQEPTVARRLEVPADSTIFMHYIPRTSSATLEAVDKRGLGGDANRG